MPAHDLPLALLKYGVPYAEDAPLLPPAGLPAEFAAPSFLRNNRWWVEEGLEDRMRSDPFPIPAVANREGYCGGLVEFGGYKGENHVGWWASGFSDYRKSTLAAAEHGVSGGRVFDFGGGTGRVFRHFAAQDPENWEVWTSDFRLSSVRWNLMHYSPAVRAFSNTSTPTLPLPDGYFDLVTAFSVFTHIDDPETQWLAELRRILRVGGLAYLTIHDENTWRASSSLRETVERSGGIRADGEMPDWKTVGIWREDDPYHCNVFHGRSYISRVWAAFFDILEIKPFAAAEQSAVVCRRTS
jgi:SAM-dependent methyltransferase